MDDDKWNKVFNQKKQKRKIKQKEIKEEEYRWEQLKKEIPHIVLPNRAKRLQTRLNIDNFEENLLSDRFIEYQRSGWKYVKVLKSVDKSVPVEIPLPTSTSQNRDIVYSILSLNNGWGDTILFSKTIEKEHSNVVF